MTKTRTKIQAEKKANLAGLRSIIEIGAPVTLASGREWRIPPAMRRPSDTRKFQRAWTRLIDMVVRSEEYDSAWTAETDHTFVVRASGPTHSGTWTVGW